MLFSKEMPVATGASDLNVQSNTSPNAVVIYNQGLYLFYVNDNDGSIWYRTTTDGANWSSEQAVALTATGMSVMKGTSPSAVVYDDTLYLFYVGSGDDGIWYTTTTNGSQWTPVQSVQKATRPMDVSSNPNAVVYNNTLYLFFIEDSGIWYTTTTTGGSNWTQVQDLQGFSSGMSALQGTSPNAAVYNDTLYVFYVGSGGDGLWYTSTDDGQSWATAVQSVAQNMLSGSQTVASNTSAWAIEFNFVPYVFWIGPGGDNNEIWYCTERTLSISASFDDIIASLEEGQEFIAVVDAPDAVGYLDTNLGPIDAPEPIALAEDSDSGIVISTPQSRNSQTRRRQEKRLSLDNVTLGIMCTFVVVIFAIIRGYQVSVGAKNALGEYNLDIKK